MKHLWLLGVVLLVGCTSEIGQSDIQIIEVGCTGSMEPLITCGDQVEIETFCCSLECT